MEVTEATDSGLWEEGIVKERTMEWGRGPRRSSAGGWQGTEEENTQTEVTACYSCIFILVQGAAHILLSVLFIKCSGIWHVRPCLPLTGEIKHVHDMEKSDVMDGRHLGKQDIRLSKPWYLFYGRMILTGQSTAVLAALWGCVTPVHNTYVWPAWWC